MRDIPMFTTEYGVASLVLKEIPYQETAYIIIRDSLEPEELLEECRGFCRACGAEKIYATGHTILEKRPFLTAIWEMRRDTAGIPDTDAALWPVQEQTLAQWRDIYNQKVKTIPNGAWMSEVDGKAMLQKGDGYFVHRGDELLGIGRASVEVIDWVASVKPGAGRDVVCALAHALTGDVVTLTVASENHKAVRLYEGLGFLKTKEISRWYEI
jgi:RimJ/RimL family protein N-acetyltransferase